MLERFFDDTGGMQLVLHSPVRRPHQPGARARAAQEVLPHVQLRAAGRGQRRRGRALARPAPQLPARGGPRLRHEPHGRGHAAQAILDSPMFLSRWRWNLNRALMVLRFRGGRQQPAADPAHGGRRPHGRGVPAGRGLPGEHHRPDRDPRPRPRAPDRSNDTLNEALDVDGVRALLERIESGDVDRALLRHHRGVGARARDPHRAAVRVPRRRGAAEPPHQRGAAPTRAHRRPRLDRRARTGRDRAGPRRDRRPSPTTADDLHDLLGSLVLVRPHDAWLERWTELVDRGRGQVLDHDGTSSGARPRRSTPPAPPSPATTAPSSRPSAATSRSPASPPSTRSPGRRSSQPGRRRDRARGPRARRASRCRAATRRADPDVEWVARRLLARMHSYSRRNRRAKASTAATAQDFMRFLLRWQHVAPGTQLGGEAGLARRASTSSRATRARPSRGSPSCCGTTAPQLPAPPARPALPRRPGELAAAHPPRPRRRRRPGRRTVEGHTDLGRVPRRPPVAPRRGPGRRPSPPSPTVGATAEILEVLRGARRVLRLRARRRDPPPARRHRARTVGRRRARAAHLRRLRRDPRPGRDTSRPAQRRRRSRLSPPGASAAPAAPRPDAGRSSRHRPGAAGVDRDELAEAVAELLLRRWGVVFRDLAVHDSLALPWRDLQWALRRLEDRGLVRGGRFVTGFSGEQYALPDAVEQLAPRAQAAARPASGSS